MDASVLTKTYRKEELFLRIMYEPLTLMVMDYCEHQPETLPSDIPPGVSLQI